GWTTYHACASFKTPANRKQTNVLQLAILWADVDAGPGKPYPDQKSALLALAYFCELLGLPLPVVVSSGFGLHIYWTLLESLSPEEWKIYANGFQQLCDQHNFHVDRVRTCDTSSILRTPGTHNRKGDASRKVVCGEFVGPYALDKFKAL